MKNVMYEDIVNGWWKISKVIGAQTPSFDTDGRDQAIY